MRPDNLHFQQFVADTDMLVEGESLLWLMVPVPLERYDLLVILQHFICLPVYFIGGDSECQ